MVLVIRLISLFWLSSTTSVLACVIAPIALFKMARATVSKKHSIPVRIYDSLFAEFKSVTLLDKHPKTVTLLDKHPKKGHIIG